MSFFYWIFRRNTNDNGHFEIHQLTFSQEQLRSAIPEKHIPHFEIQSREKGWKVVFFLPYSNI